MENRLMIGIDIGATKIASVLINFQGDVIDFNTTPTKPTEGYQSVAARTANQINELIALASQEIQGIGIGVPGLIDSKQGVVIDAVNLGWKNAPLVTEIKKHVNFETPIYLMTDALASALGEFHFGAGKGCQDFFYLTIGSGLGGAFIANGQLVRGEHGIAGAVGHFPLFPEGRQCVCGLCGCPETVISGKGLLSTVRELLTKGKHQSCLNETSELTTRAILKAARQGDSLAAAAFYEMGRHAGILISIIGAIVDPKRIVIGGGLGLAAYDIFIPAANEELRKRALPPFHPGYQLCPSALESSAVGAACLALDQRL